MVCFTALLAHFFVIVLLLVLPIKALFPLQNLHLHPFFADFSFFCCAFSSGKVVVLVIVHALHYSAPE